MNTTNISELVSYLGQNIEFTNEKQIIQVYAVKHPEWSPDEYYKWEYWTNFVDFNKMLSDKYNIHPSSFKHISYNLKKGWVEIKTLTAECYTKADGRCVIKIEGVEHLVWKI